MPWVSLGVGVSSGGDGGGGHGGGGVGAGGRCLPQADISDRKNSATGVDGWDDGVG